jgi:hypothetical protein
MSVQSNPFPNLPAVDPAIVRSIRQASQATSTDFRLLMAQAAQESSFQPDAKASGSSAAGLFQFIDSTWLDMVRRFGAKYGLGALAQQIGTDTAGRPVVTDPAVRRKILELRNDPRLSASLAGEYNRLNKAEVEHALGHAVGPADLYMAHFLGAAGATTFLKAMERNGGTTAADLLPDAAAANRAVFYDARTGEPRTVAQIYRTLAGRIEKEMQALGSAQMAEGSDIPSPAGAPALFGSRLDWSGTAGAQLSQPLLAMLNVMTLAALKLVGGGPPAAAAPQLSSSDRRSL